MSHLRLLRLLLAPWLHGGWRYYAWMALLASGMTLGLLGLVRQHQQGLAVTGMGDQVLWGLYIGQFTFLVGVAASAVILVLPAHLFHRPEAGRVLPFGEALAVTAVTMSLLAVWVDLGQPLRVWHALPLLGTPNFPASILAWDMVVLTLYLVANLGALYTACYRRMQGGSASPSWPVALFLVVLGLAIHTVTAFLLAGVPARPFWHSAVLAPRFIAGAFASGSALMILTFKILHCHTPWRLGRATVAYLALILLFAQWIQLFLLGSESFVHFYPPGISQEAATHLYFSQEAGALPIRLAILANLVAAMLLSFPQGRKSPWRLNLACGLSLVGIWYEKGLGLVVSGFVPSPLGEVASYAPTLVEIQIVVGIWAAGACGFTLLVRSILAVGVVARPLTTMAGHWSGVGGHRAR